MTTQQARGPGFRLVNSTGWKVSIGYTVAVALALMLIYSFLLAPHPENISYSEFKTLLKKGKVGDLVLDAHAITGTLSIEGLEGRARPGGGRFVTARVDDPGLVAELEAANVKFTGRMENAWISTVLSWVLPTLLFMGVWIFVMRRMGGAQGGLLAVGKSKAKVYVQHSTGVTFDDVAGIDEARSELMEIVDFLKAPERYQRLGGRRCWR